MRTQTKLTKLLTDREVAALLGVKPQTLAVWRSTKRYDLPYIKIGRSVKYDERDLEAFIASRRVECPPVEV